MFEQLRLHITNDAYVFTPMYEPAQLAVASNKSLDTLTIHRDSGVMELNAPPLHSTVPHDLVVYGIMGFINLHAGEYMIVVTERQRIGSLQGHDIFQATSFKMLRVPRSTTGLSEQMLQDEERYIHMVETHLQQNAFYYSYTYPITLSVQRQTNADRTAPLWKQTDDRFFWNRYLSNKMIEATMDLSDKANYDSFILPMIQGFVSIVTTMIHQQAVTFGLISRRSHQRAGTRYFSRGLDSSGHASNFVETEQILLCDQKHPVGPYKTQMAYVQTRGSMPALWGQTPNIRYTPRLWLNTELSDNHVLEASRNHLAEQIRLYGPQILVNLVNKKGYELSVGQLFEQLVQALNDLDLFYVHFDFHHECCNMRWNRVQLLIDQLEPELRKQGYCHLDMSLPEDPVIRQIQSSVVRSNCMDCLDRTNVVQSTLARWVLNQQLREAGILQSTDVIENDIRFMTIFREVWANNADALSVAYSGTGALKTDYTRTGVRTRAGALRDLQNSIIRYVKNNYLDGSRQDGFDLVLGKYKVPLASSVGGHRESPFAKQKPVSVRVVPALLLLSFGVFLFALFFPSGINIASTTFYVMFLALCFATILSTCHFMLEHGTQYVDWPKLINIAPVADIATAAEPSITVVTKRHPFSLSWRHKRDSTGMLDEIEQGHELPTLKKTT
ncbi:SacI homology domain-containing protein [Radiomyces spectabilis]|uniref:SacI homology domain-containing protein n=1 Tax=Radiomyces spectabilis TaxID=64574 RepID=UPI0022210A63|nr:SacI homology domain-containing protein [Radiomyces spectabilis]KAI8364685.1 SacI homology domain-containing protein [Radiomyces spectabilis]